MSKIAIRTGNCQKLEAVLSQRVAEYNAAATGYHDAESFGASQRGESGEIEAGVSGYTWGGVCYVSYLWVSEGQRLRGIGRELLNAVEHHARDKRCRMILLSSHTFQAPEFYARLGYEAVARINDYPNRHADIFLAKRLAT